MNENKHTIEEALEKFMRLDQESKEFVLGYVVGKHDEKQTAK